MELFQSETERGSFKGPIFSFMDGIAVSRNCNGLGVIPNFTKATASALDVQLLLLHKECQMTLFLGWVTGQVLQLKTTYDFLLFALEYLFHWDSRPKQLSMGLF